MTTLKRTTDAAFETKMKAYPDHIRNKMQHFRSLIIQTAEETPAIEDLEETLKWGEPSFLSTHGSTVRMDWKKKTPNQYQLYFKCTSRLVETFKTVFGDFFDYEKNRAIIFKLENEVPSKELKRCIKTALLYHKVKDKINLDI